MGAIDREGHREGAAPELERPHDEAERGLVVVKRAVHVGGELIRAVPVIGFGETCGRRSCRRT